MTGGPARPLVLSVVGPGRSGTTVLASVLGEVDGVVAAGELRWLWRRGVVEGRPCGCGEPAVRCPVWSAVLAQVLGAAPFVRDGIAIPALAGVIRDQADVSSRRQRLRVIASADGSPGWPALDRLREVSGQVVTALAGVTGASVVVDTSKRAQEAAVLAGSGSVDQYVLQIVRDPRAVAWSWGRAKPIRSAAGEQPMATRSPASSAARWVENCVGAQLLQRQLPASRWLPIRYEDFVAEPRGVVQAVLDFLGLEAQSPIAADRTVHLGENHTIAGNPNRFRTGLVKIQPDDEWRRRMPVRQRRLVEAVTLPLLHRYQYPILSRSTS